MSLVRATISALTLICYVAYFIKEILHKCLASLVSSNLCPSLSSNITINYKFQNAFAVKACEYSMYTQQRGSQAEGCS